LFHRDLKYLNLTCLKLTCEHKTMNLNEYLLSFSGKNAAEAEKLGIGIYRQYYLDNGKAFGVRKNHADEVVMFFEDRFEHAFWTSSNRARYPDKKDVIALDRLERIQWIYLVISGRVPGVECWHVPSITGRRRPPNCLYIVWEEGYVVWLEPRNNGGWRFSSAYVTGRADIRRYCFGGGKVWTAPKK